MSKPAESVLGTLGLLRQALLVTALVNMILPMLYLLFEPRDEGSFWVLVATMITPALSLLFAVVILFDYIMSRVRAADSEGDERVRFTSIGRVELAVLAITMAFWVPYFIYLLS